MNGLSNTECPNIECPNIVQVKYWIPKLEHKFFVYVKIILMVNDELILFYNCSTLSSRFQSIQFLEFGH